MKLELLLIDPQHDFCAPDGALFVAGADRDAERLAGLIRRIGARLHGIRVTLDTHHYFDIAHPVFWVDGSGNHPQPFTVISVEAVRAGAWRAVRPELQQRAAAYVEQLQAKRRYQLCIWPPHCLIGTPGHCVVAPVREALLDWERGRSAIVDYVTKGSNVLTEHYSAVQAEVPDPADPNTQLNVPLINILRESDRILISGQALSHCVANTLRDIADSFGPENVKKFVLIQDTTSPVPGFEHVGREFIREMTGRGMALARAADL